MNKIVPFVVKKNFIHYRMHVLNSGVYTEMMPFGDNDTIVTFQEQEFASMPLGSVFVPFNPYRQWSFDEPSCYMVKMLYGNYYLTGDEETPLGVSRDTYDSVLAVV